MRLIENVKVVKTKTGVRRQFNKDNPPVFEKETDVFKVDIPTLPNYSMVGNIVNGRVNISVPDDEAEEIGNSGKFRVSKDKIRKKYRGQSRFDNDDPLDI